MNPSSLSTHRADVPERIIESMDAHVYDQSQGHRYTAVNGGKIEIHTGPQITINSESHPNKGKLPSLPRCPAPCTGYVPRQHLEDHMSCYFFSSNHDSQRRKRYVIHGLGGSGKTQGALTFIDKHFYSLEPELRRFSEAYWVDATSVETISKSLEDIARSAGAGTTADDALCFLTAHGPKSNWVMLYNNADDPSLDLTKYFPRCTHGNIIITTRNRHASRYGLGSGSDYALSGMEPGEAEALLLDQARLFDPSPTSIQVVNQLIKELKYFPLSVRQAGAYISATLCTVSEYLDMFKTCREELLREYDNAEEYEYSSVEATLSLSFAKLSPEAQQLLLLCSRLHCEHIVDKIWQDGFLGLEDYRSDYENLSSPDEESAIASLMNFREKLSLNGRWDIKRFRGLLKELQCYSLILYIPELASCSIHPLVQEWGQSTSQGSLTKAPLSCAVSILLGSAIAQNRSETVEELSFLRTLALHVDQIAQDKDLPLNGCNNEFGFVYNIIGRWNDEHNFLEKYNEACKRILGHEHVETLISTHNLAETYRRQGNYQKAAEMHSEVLELSKVKLGANHPDTLISMSGLAMTYRNQGNYQKAAEIHSEVLENQRVRLGEDHLDTLVSMSCLAITYQNLGKYQKAMELYSGVLAIRKTRLGEDHPDTLGSMHNLAMTYQDLGNRQKAVDMLSEVLEIRKVRSGVDHPHTLISMNCLAFAYWDLKDFDNAIELFLQLTELNKARFGTDHSETQESMQHLIDVLEEQRNSQLTPHLLFSPDNHSRLIHNAQSVHQEDTNKCSTPFELPAPANFCIHRTHLSCTSGATEKRKRECDTPASSKRICMDLAADSVIRYSDTSSGFGSNGSRSSYCGRKA